MIYGDTKMGRRRRRLGREMFQWIDDDDRVEQRHTERRTEHFGAEKFFFDFSDFKNLETGK